MAAPSDTCAFILTVAGVTLFKCLLVPAYRSTDFEVHRNWLAITHSLPISKWYYEDTSEWTLDYPPLFAWLELALSHAARWFDPAMLAVGNVGYASPATVLFQRLSVTATDALLVYAAWECSRCVRGKVKGRPGELTLSPGLGFAALIVTNVGLLLVDHIHFQYNGFLSGLMLLSIARLYQGKVYTAAFLFSLLLNFKHIYLYLAPAYGVHMLRTFCFTRSRPDGGVLWRSLSVARLLGLAAIVLSVFACSFGPFIAMGQLPQVLSRLFPFRRGLCHAYWAPNAWALYNAADKALAIAGVRAGLWNGSSVATAAMTGGLVREAEHAVLPSVPPGATVACTLLATLPALWALWSRPCGPRHFVRCATLCALAAFLFGWHVHEKAILIAILPLTLLAVESREDAETFLILATTGHLSLFPLIFTLPELPIKIGLMLMYTIFSFSTLRSLVCGARERLLGPCAAGYLAGLATLALLVEVAFPLSPWRSALPFLPLLATSCYCAVGVALAWLRLLRSLGSARRPRGRDDDRRKAQ
ncbi:probable dolichyl pyrophosphate Glc1Man9GlcNAc2 alpha-1,3-glucosyltransferase [Lethenteron reissneri]|uniref:probable dolichyl pyrophosphate Glc1Man9GlcNAc2 alpha-1,3-glucosyltransferase n=1 Tax=Lethenteron reissneri TaxID=7753 RepID=UPI002AB64139|nr:probable dolichyl pyrophosphate Glc1Man9GlcNAc2 alpha-1,3-glucosyltransferase [Lethenteron reissneri]